MVTPNSVQLFPGGLSAEYWRHLVKGRSVLLCWPFNMWEFLQQPQPKRGFHLQIAPLRCYQSALNPGCKQYSQAISNDQYWFAREFTRLQRRSNSPSQDMWKPTTMYVTTIRKTCSVLLKKKRMIIKGTLSSNSTCTSKYVFSLLSVIWNQYFGLKVALHQLAAVS